MTYIMWSVSGPVVDFSFAVRPEFIGYRVG
jgi:hypothetical protein